MLEINLKGKNALVTGGSKGVGAGICEMLAKAGANIIINYASSDEKAQEVLKKAKSFGVEAYLYKADITDLENVKEMMSFVEDKFGKLDILVNNAGTTIIKKIDEITPKDWEKVHKLNLDSVYYVTHNAIPLLRKAGGASITSIGSTSMYTGSGGGGHYASSKAALMGYTRALAKELGADKITANVLAISLIQTELMDLTTPDDVKDKKRRGVPVGRLGTPEEIGCIVAFLASDMATYISGEMITVDGGRTFA